MVKLHLTGDGYILDLSSGTTGGNGKIIIDGEEITVECTDTIKIISPEIHLVGTVFIDGDLII